MPSRSSDHNGRTFFIRTKHSRPEEASSAPSGGDTYTVTINNTIYTAPMDELTLAKKVYDLLSPTLKKNKVVKTIAEDFKEATNTSLLELWEKVKPIFIEEFEEDEKLSDDILSPTVVERELKKAFIKDSLLKESVQRSVATLDVPSSPITTIGKDNVINTGPISGNTGNVTIGNPKKE